MMGYPSSAKRLTRLKYATKCRHINISVKQTFINLRHLVKIMSKIVALDGELLLGYLMGRFGMSIDEAIQNMRENGQDLSFMQQ